jgi:hypothetical protein
MHIGALIHVHFLCLYLKLLLDCTFYKNVEKLQDYLAIFQDLYFDDYIFMKTYRS